MFILLRKNTNKDNVFMLYFNIFFTFDEEKIKSMVFVLRFNIKVFF